MESHTPSISEDRQRQDPMGWLFGELHGIFGNPFLDRFRSGHVIDGRDTGIENMKSVWAERIRSSRMNFGEIKRGLQNAQHVGGFPPGWPEFYQLCRPMPNIDEAMAEAMQQIPLRSEGKDQWSHPAIYWAASKVGFFEMMNRGGNARQGETVRQRFADALRKAIAEDMPAVPPASVAPKLPAPVVTPEQIQQARALVSSFSLKDMRGEPGDRLAWARRIVERDAAGDRTVSLYVLHAARQALGIVVKRREAK